jgi:hypothetical protein
MDIYVNIIYELQKANNIEHKNYWNDLLNYDLKLYNQYEVKLLKKTHIEEQKLNFLRTLSLYINIIYFNLYYLKLIISNNSKSTINEETIHLLILSIVSDCISNIHIVFNDLKKNNYIDENKINNLKESLLNDLDISNVINNDELSTLLLNKDIDDKIYDKFELNIYNKFLKYLDDILECF